MPVNVPDDPQVAGALGTALIALDLCEKSDCRVCNVNIPTKRSEL
jgi:hypothetical protein